MSRRIAALLAAVALSGTLTLVIQSGDNPGSSVNAGTRVTVVDGQNW